jgi:filamentous hemagglutinin family protein
MLSRAATVQDRTESRNSAAPSIAVVVLAAAFHAGLCPARAQSVLPHGGSVTAGAATIGAAAGNALTITQSSQRAIINWNSFSIGAGGAVSFVQPDASAAVLNRVTGATRSTIAGQLTANGQVYLVNPNGIALTPSGAVNVGGGFVASTLGIADADFSSGNLNFTGSGASAGISNAGSISAALGGFVGLLGGTVANSGTISAPLGKIGLGSGEQATLDLNGDGFLQVAIPTTSASGSQLLIGVSGKVRAAGGRVEIKAATAAQVVRDVVNISGEVSASSAHRDGGVIVLDGGAGGQVAVSGKVAATSKSARGGSVQIGGPSIDLRGALVDVSGATGGGTVTIGGGSHGAAVPGLTTAQTVSLDAASTIEADAKQSGDGGRVTIWSNDLTDFRGTISAQALGAAGNGGEAEVSGGVLNYQGTTNLLSAHGVAGTLLLDPYDVTISNGTGSNYNFSTFTATGNSSVINATTLENALSLASVTVSTGSSGGQSGAITLANPVSWTAATTLTLSAASTIALQAGVYAPSGGLTLTAGSSSSAITASGAIDVGAFDLTQGAWSQNTASLPRFYAGNFIVGSNASFLRALGGAGTSGSPYLLTDVYGLQGAASGTFASSSFSLANDIDASVTSGWNSGAGFTPIGNHSQAYTGTFDGQNHAIVNLDIDLPSSTSVGLFGYVSGANAKVKNLSLLEATVTGSGASGNYGTGILVGAADDGATIANVVTTGSVTGVGAGHTGGIAGNLTGATLSNSSTAAAVNNSYGDAVGGAVGSLENGATMTGVSSSGPINVTGGAFMYVGGLVGWVGNTAANTISNSYSTSPITVNSSAAPGADVGGLTGYATLLNINSSYAANTIDVTAGSASVGALSGWIDSPVNASYVYWNSTLAGSLGAAGDDSTYTGASSLTSTQMLTASNFSGFDFSGTFYLNANGFYFPTLRSATTILASTSSGLTISTSADSPTNINATSLQDFLGAGNVLVSTTGGALTVTTPVSWSSAANLSLASSGLFTVSAAANLTATSAGNLGLYAVSGSTAGAAMTLDAATISTSSGNLSIMAPNAGSNSAITFNGATLGAGAGTGTIVGGSTSGFGVYLAPSTILTTSGAVGMTAASQSSHGFYAGASAGIVDNSGGLTIAGASTFGIGVYFYSGAQSIANDGASSVQITGISTATSNYGLAINSNLTTSGAVSISGTDTNTSYGAYLNGSAITDSSGALTISGASVSGNAIWVNGGTLALTDSGAGAFQMIGSSTSGRGIRFNTGADLTTSGAVTLSGTSSTSDGLSFKGSNTITISSGAPTLSGVSTSGNGVYFQNSVVIANQTASQVAIAGTSANNFGFKIESGANVSSSGSVLLSGMSTNFYGLNNVGGNTISTTSEALTLSGTSTTGTGVYLSGTTQLTNGGAGLTIVGSSSSSSGEGVYIASGASYTTSGGIAFTDTAGSSGTNAIDIAGTLSASSGALTLAPTSANAILIENGAIVTSTGSGGLALTVNGGGTITNDGTISQGTGGSGAITLTAANGTLRNAGTIFGSATAGAITLTTTGSGSITDGSGTITQAGAGAIKLQAAGAGAIAADAIAYSNAAANTLTLAASAGDVTLGNFLASSGGALTLNVSGRNISGGGNINSNGGLATFSLTGSGTLSGVISGSGGLTMAEAGTLTLSGVNTFSGATTVSAGTLDIGSAGSLGSGSYAHTISIASGATFEYSSSAAQTLSGLISGAGALTKDTSTSSTLTLSDANSYTGATTINAGTLDLTNATASSAFSVASGAMLQAGSSSSYNFNTANSSISGAGTFQKIGSGTLTMAGSASTFSWQMSGGGLIDVEAGTLIGGTYGHDTWTSNLSSLNVASGATFSGVEANVMVDALTGSGTVMSGWSGEGSVTFGVNNSSSTFAGVLSNNTSGNYTASYVKAGSGTITTTGANTYTGTTTVTGGTLVWAPQSIINTFTSTAIDIDNGSTFQVASPTGRVDFPNANITFDANGGGRVDFAGLNNYGGPNLTGPMTISATGGAQDVVESTSGAGLNLNYTLTLSTTNGGSLLVSANLWNHGSVSKTGAGLAELTGSNSYSGGTTISAGTLQIGSAGTLGTGSYAGNISIASGATLEYSSSAAQTLSGAISGAGAVTKDTSSSSTLTLSGANAYTGATNVSAGTASLSGSWNVGAGTATAVVASGATFSGAGTITAATFSDSGGGTVSLTGANAVGALSSSGTVGPFTFNNAQSLAIGSISSSGAVSVTTSAGSGANLTLSSGTTLTSSAANTAITLSADHAFINNAGSGALSASNGRWLVFSSAPGVDTFGNLNSGATAVWGATYASSGGSIAQSGNRYVFAYQPTLTFSSTSDSKTYGVNDATAVAADYAVTGYQTGVSGAFLSDTAASAFSGAPSVTSTGSAAGAGVASSPYAITIAQGTLSSTAGYALAFASPGVLTVNPAALTITANDQTMTYGGTLPTLTASYLGFVNGDSAASLTTTPTLSSATSASANAGTYTNNLTANGAADSNYTISYLPGTLTIGKAALTITANPAVKTYDGQNYVGGNGVVYSGFVNGQNAAALGGSLSYGGTAQGAVDVGSYSLTTSGLSSNNYAISYTPSTLTVAARPLSVTADPQSRVYGDANPDLTYTISGDGLVVGDALTGQLAAAATATSGVDAYAIGLGSLSASRNYALTYIGADLTITPRPILVTAQDTSRSYGEANPVLPYTIGGDGLANGDTLIGQLATSANLTSQAAAFPISVGSLSAGPNYALTFLGADLTVTPLVPNPAQNPQRYTEALAPPAVSKTFGGLTANVVDCGSALTYALATSWSQVDLTLAPANCAGRRIANGAHASSH